jgi:hypothetical protein
MVKKLIGDLFDEGLRSSRTERPPSDKWRGSLLGSCLRQQWYYANGETPTDDRGDEVFRIFERGHIINDSFNRRLRDSEHLISYEEEVPVSIPELRFAGNADGVVQWKDGQHELIEYKSVKDSAWKFIPKPEHQIQASIYAECLTRMRGHEYSARLVYIRASDLVTAEFIVDEQWKNKSLRILKILNSDRFKDTPPWRLPEEKYRSKKTGNWLFPCGYCPFLTKCRGGENGD